VSSELSIVAASRPIDARSTPQRSACFTDRGTGCSRRHGHGLRYSWSAAAAPCAKIVDVVFTPTKVTVTPPVVTGAPEMIVVGGVVQNPTKAYRVTVNNFIATGGDGFTVLLGGLNTLGGAQDIDALVAYFASGYKAPKAPYEPTQAALAIPRISRLP
jgi:5'-nucleotidase